MVFVGFLSPERARMTPILVNFDSFCHMLVKFVQFGPILSKFGQICPILVKFGPVSGSKRDPSHPPSAKIERGQGVLFI